MLNRISEIGIHISIQNLLREESMIFPDMTFVTDRFIIEQTKTCSQKATRSL